MNQDAIFSQFGSIFCHLICRHIQTLKSVFLLQIKSENPTILIKSSIDFFSICQNDYGYKISW